MKKREAYFRDWDHQMMMEMYAVRAKDVRRDEGPVGHLHDLGAVPAAERALEIIAPPKDGAAMPVRLGRDG